MHQPCKGLSLKAFMGVLAYCAFRKISIVFRVCLYAVGVDWGFLYGLGYIRTISDLQLNAATY